MSSSTPHQQPALSDALKASRVAFALVFAYSCGYNLLLLAPAIYLLQLYDRVLSSRSTDTLVMLTLIIASAVVVGGILDAFRRVTLSRIGAWLDDRLRPTLLVSSLQYALRADPHTASDAYSDLTNLRQFIESQSFVLLLDAIWAPLFLFVLFLVHPILGAVGVVSVLMLSTLTLVGEAVTREPLARAAYAQARSLRRFQAVLRNVHMIRAMGMLSGAARLVCDEYRPARNAQDSAARRSEFVQVLIKPLKALAQIAIMGTSAWLVLEHEGNPGIIFAGNLLFTRGLAPIEGAVSSWKAITSARRSYTRLNDVCAAVTAVNTTILPLPRPEGNLLVEDLSLMLPKSDCFALRGISFSLDPGECLGVIGPSGAGKSLLGRVIAGITLPTHGRVQLDGTDMAALRNTGGSYLGYLPQDVELVGGTVKQYIARLAEGDTEMAVAAAKLVGIHEAIMRLPQAYDTEIDCAGIELLPGERQRLGLACAVFGNPCLVVLDEPNASLDYRSEQVLYDVIERMKDACITVVIITHRTGILAATDKVAILQNGALAAFGRTDKIYLEHVQQRQINISRGEPQAVIEGD